MKRLILSLATLAAMFAGCQKHELEGTAHDEKQAFVASVEGFGAQTRTSLAPGNYVVWSSGDCLAIFQGSSIADEYILAEGSAGLNSGSFKWVADNSTVNGDFSAGTELPCNVAFYPYSDDLNLTGDMEENKTGYVLSNVVLPNTQVYSANSFGNGAFPMVAVTENMEDHNLKFKNVLGAMKLQFKGNIAVKSIKVEGANGEKLSGAAKVTAYANNLTPAITMTCTDEASKSVTLDCGDGVQLNEEEATNFYIALPPVLFEKGFTATIADAKSREYTVTATSVNTILRSSILVMPEVELKSSVSDNEGDYVDEYGINHGPGVEIHGVVWAPVNCGYHATDYQWGKLYQWGRKYGQGYSGKLYDEYVDEIGEVTDATTPYISDGPVSLQDGQSVKNKNVFFTCPVDPYDWLYPQDDMLWNSGSEVSPVKTEYDPCPDGWRVPTYKELSELCRNHSSWTTDDADQVGYWFSGSLSYSSKAAQVFIPAAGCRYSSNGDAVARGFYGGYWSSRPRNDYDFGAYCLEFNNSIAEMSDNVIYPNANGYSVRCVQD